MYYIYVVKRSIAQTQTLHLFAHTTRCVSGSSNTPSWMSHRRVHKISVPTAVMYPRYQRSRMVINRHSDSGDKSSTKILIFSKLKI